MPPLPLPLRLAARAPRARARGFPLFPSCPALGGAAPRAPPAGGGAVPPGVGPAARGGLSRGFALGPRVLARIDVVERGGFLETGMPFGETARIALPGGTALAPAKTALQRALGAAEPAGGYRLTDRSDSAPGLRRMIDEL